MKRTLPPRSKHQTDRLRRITEVIREVAGEDLAMLILFGSYARGDWVEDRYVEDNIVYSYRSDFDLLVVVQKGARATQKGAFNLTDHVARRLRQEALDHPTASLVVEYIKHLNDDLERGSYFFTDIKKEGVLLYDNGRHKLARRRKLDAKQRQAHARDDYRHWFKSAGEFLIHSEDGLKRRWNKEAAFLLHQATERLLVATILTFTAYKPKTHDLADLYRRVCNLCSDYFTAFPQETPKEIRRFDLLRRAYIDARYKRDYKITKAELTYLLARVKKLQTLTKKICRKEIRRLGGAE